MLPDLNTYRRGTAGLLAELAAIEDAVSMWRRTPWRWWHLRNIRRVRAKMVAEQHKAIILHTYLTHLQATNEPWRTDNEADR